MIYIHLNVKHPKLLYILFFIASYDKIKVVAVTLLDGTETKTAIISKNIGSGGYVMSQPAVITIFIYANKAGWLIRNARIILLTKLQYSSFG